MWLTRDGGRRHAEDVPDAVPASLRCRHDRDASRPGRCAGSGSYGQTVPPGEAATVPSPVAQMRNVPEVLLEYL